MLLLTNSCECMAVEGPDLSNEHYKTGKLNFSSLISFFFLCVCVCVGGGGGGGGDRVRFIESDL